MKLENPCSECKKEEVSNYTFQLCRQCNKNREVAYDNYVDPTGFYQNKNFDLD